jgi:hypothetical protein
MFVINRPALRWSVALLGGGALALLVGWLATLPTSSDEDALRLVVFALTTSPVLVGGLWVLTAPPDGNVAFVEDTVEHAWVQRAGFGSFCDLLVAMGIAVAVTQVLSLPDLPLLYFLVLATVSFPLRYAVLARRG